MKNFFYCLLLAGCCSVAIKAAAHCTVSNNIPTASPPEVSELYSGEINRFPATAFKF